MSREKLEKLDFAGKHLARNDIFALVGVFSEEWFSSQSAKDLKNFAKYVLKTSGVEPLSDHEAEMLYMFDAMRTFRNSRATQDKNSLDSLVFEKIRSSLTYEYQESRLQEGLDGMTTSFQDAPKEVLKKKVSERVISQIQSGKFYGTVDCSGEFVAGVFDREGKFVKRNLKQPWLANLFVDQDWVSAVADDNLVRFGFEVPVANDSVATLSASRNNGFVEVNYSAPIREIKVEKKVDIMAVMMITTAIQWLQSCESKSIQQAFVASYRQAKQYGDTEGFFAVMVKDRGYVKPETRVKAAIDFVGQLWRQDVERRSNLSSASNATKIRLIGNGVSPEVTPQSSYGTIIGDDQAQEMREKSPLSSSTRSSFFDPKTEGARDSFGPINLDDMLPPLPQGPITHGLLCGRH